MARNLLTSLIGVLIGIFALLFLEVLVRVLRTDINHQDTERALFMERAFGESPGWRPGASGVSFGERVYIDDQGFRKPDRQPASGKAWLILGDSVAFGVGVENNSTFVTLMQTARPDIRVINTAVVGYATGNYRDVLQRHVSTRDLEKVVLFYCLNDTYDDLRAVPEDTGGVNRILGFLRRNSKLYMLMKNTFFDRSKPYFENDFREYGTDNLRFIRTVGLLTEMNDLLMKRKIAFQVVMLPYEYQLRMQEKNLLKPQEAMAKVLPARVKFVDLYPCLSGQAKDSARLFLYADAMHFSKAGHKAVFDCLNSDPQLQGKVEAPAPEGLLFGTSFPKVPPGALRVMSGLPDTQKDF